MANVLILYPRLFNCYSKFSRKVEKITSSLNDVVLVYQDDPNDFIKKISEEKRIEKKCLRLVNLGAIGVTHAIVFDDGEEFKDQIEEINRLGLPLRIVAIAITRVINIKKEPEYQSQKSTPSYEYIGRGSYWGNPYSMYEEGEDREEVIRKYRYDFEYEKFPNKEKSEVYKLAGKRLGCFCKPQACHGDILADFLNSWDDGK